MMVEPRYTSVMRSTRSGNYYNVPISADTVANNRDDVSTFTSHDGFEYEAVAAAWGTTSMRRLPALAKRRDLNAALDSVAPSKDPHTFQPSFAFDLNKLVASLTKGSSSSSHNSSFTSTRSHGEPVSEPMPENSRIPVLPVEPDNAPRQRGRRGALSGEEELTRPYAPTTSAAPSIISYSLNKRKQKRLAAKALAAASVNGPNFEVAVADAGNEHQPQYVPRYVPEYQSDAAIPSTSRNREPSLDQQSYAL